MDFQPVTDRADRIRPHAAYPSYWEYKREPVLLLGGSKDDNLFQIPDLQEHLDLLASVGGNCIRNTMSDRQDKGYEAYPYRRLPSGKYDLTQWNDEYWRRFETMLRLTHERDVIVQIEVWDRFDQTDAKGNGHWQKSPYRPANNTNYTGRQTGLADRYPAHPSRDRQPFYHSIPGMAQYRPKYDRIRKFQERFVAKMLSYSLPYGNVLYCMNNETSTDPRWGQHWMAFIRGKAAEVGTEVYVTDMFDDAWKPEVSAKLKQAIAQPELYPFLDVSQVNSRNFGEDHWRRSHWAVRQVAARPRPLNHTKIYSAGQTSFGSGTPKDGVERFWRNLIAGAASSRFHRPTSGIGLNEISQACIRSARKVETLVKFWHVDAHLDLLRDRGKNEAYLAAKPGEQYVLFFTDAGSVGLDLTQHVGTFRGRWVDINSGEWGDAVEWPAGRVVTVAAPGPGPWVAVATKVGSKR